MHAGNLVKIVTLLYLIFWVLFFGWIIVAGTGRFRASPGLMNAPTAYPGSSSSPYFHQPPAQPPFPYSAYGWANLNIFYYYIYWILKKSLNIAAFLLLAD